MAITALVFLVLLVGIIGVPFIRIGGAGTCIHDVCHAESTYGAASWLFVCAGGEWAQAPGGVSTGMAIFPISLNTSWGQYFFAQCVFGW